MLIRFAIFPLVLVLGLSMCRKQTAAVAPAGTPSPTASAAEVKPPSEGSGGTAKAAAPNAAVSGSPAALTKSGKTVVDQTAQVIVYGYHRFVDKVKRPDTEITP